MSEFIAEITAHICRLWKRIGLHRFIHATASLLVAATVIVAATPASAGENTLNLPPAEYKGLPAGTVVKLLDSDDHPTSYRVTHSEGYELTYKVRNKKLRKRYALFGRDWDNAYSFGTVSRWRADFGGNAKQAVISAMNSE